MKLQNLPIETQTQVRDTLTAYAKCNVYQTQDGYKVSTGSFISAHDHGEKFIETFHSKDILTKNEKILGHINNFRSFPSDYEGKRDWPLLNRFTDNYKNGTNIQIGLDRDGNIIEL